MHYPNVITIIILLLTAVALATPIVAVVVYARRERSKAPPVS